MFVMKLKNVIFVFNGNEKPPDGILGLDSSFRSNPDVTAASLKVLVGDLQNRLELAGPVLKRFCR